MSNNISSPIGIGNYVGQTITLYSHNDAMNQLGDQDPSIVFNRLNFSDYTGYVPHNTAFDFAFPNLWAPLVQLYDNTTWIVQNFATPQMSLAPTFSGYDANALAATLPGTGAEWSKGNHPKKTAYINQNLDLIALSANLSDTQKMFAEVFNNKSASLIYQTNWFIGQQYSTLNITQPIITGYKILAIATRSYYEPIPFVWTAKILFNAPRPQSEIPFLFTGTNINAWANNQGNQTMDGSNWQAYLPTANFAEYPSTTACVNFCLLETFKQLRGGSDSGWNIPYFFQQGSSAIEPGLTPRSNITTSLSNISDSKNMAALSRQYGGVHYNAASFDHQSTCEGISHGLVSAFTTELGGDAFFI